MREKQNVIVKSMVYNIFAITDATEVNETKFIKYNQKRTLIMTVQLQLMSAIISGGSYVDVIYVCAK